MARRIVMWIAVVSLVALGGVSGASAVIYLWQNGNTGWTYYTPYSVTVAPVSNVASFCAIAQRVLLPVAALSSAFYIYLAERAFQQLNPRRGFELQFSQRSGDT
jgi:hypothetical protein